MLVLAALIGPSFTSADYSSISNSISELAGQALPNAWIMRLGFAGFGTGILIASALDPRRPLTRAATAAFGLSMLLVAVFPTRPIDPTAPFDARADRLHSVFAFTAGLAFSAACMSRLFLPGGSLRDGLSWTGLVASVLLPLLMVQAPEVDGVLQRVMFAISVVWLWREFGSGGWPLGVRPQETAAPPRR